MARSGGAHPSFLGNCPHPAAAYGEPVVDASAGRASLARIERICSDERDAKVLRVRLLDEIRRVIAFGPYVWLLTDPDTTVGCAPLADVPGLHELARLIKFKYLTDVNRWTGLIADGPASRSLSATTEGDLSRSLVWQMVMRHYDITDVASTAFGDRYGCWGFLDLWRGPGSGPYTRGETDYLSAAAPTVTEALRRAQAATFDQAPVTQRRGTGPAVLLLDDELNVISQTAAAQDWLRVLVPPAGNERAIPAAVYNTAAQLLAVERGVDHHPASARVHLAQGFWVTLRAARLDDQGAPGRASIAVTLEDTSPGERLEVFTRSFGLSPREAELLGQLATGTDTRDLAARLYLSEHTIQDHLKSIFAKTATRNRRTLLSRALGSRADDDQP